MDLNGSIQIEDSAGVMINIGGMFPDDGNRTYGTTAFFNHWQNAQRVSVHEVGDTIEMVYIEVSNVTLAVYPPRPPARRVYKVIYSCKDGKWNKSEKIYGEIIPAQDEQYEFE